MGLLDDAIREHLELKRKHGANPEDVARQEQEALGPGLRNELAQPEGTEPEPPAPAPGYDEDPWLEDDRDEVPAEEALQPPSHPRPSGEEEDVLEETPDFLQETPEHERLWF